MENGTSASRVQKRGMAGMDMAAFVLAPVRLDRFVLWIQMFVLGSFLGDASRPPGWDHTFIYLFVYFCLGVTELLVWFCTFFMPVVLSNSALQQCGGLVSQKK